MVTVPVSLICNYKPLDSSLWMFGSWLLVIMLVNINKLLATYKNLPLLGKHIPHINRHEYLCRDILPVSLVMLPGYVDYISE